MSRLFHWLAFAWLVAFAVMLSGGVTYGLLDECRRFWDERLYYPAVLMVLLLPFVPVVALAGCCALYQGLFSRPKDVSK